MDKINNEEIENTDDETMDSEITDEIEDEDIDEFDDEGDDEDLSVAEKVIGVFITPSRTFKYLSQNPDFWSAFIILSLVVIAVTMPSMKLILPGTIVLVRSQLEGAGMSENEMAMVIKAIPYIVYGQTILGIPIGLLVSWLLMTAAVFFIGLMQGLKTDFKRLFGVLPWLSFISVLPGQIITAIMIGTGYISEMTQMTDLKLMKPYSLLGPIPGGENLPKFVQGLLASIDPFFIWSIFVTVIALQYANNCKKSEAIVTTVIIAVLTLVLSGLLTSFGMMAQAG